MQSRSDSAWWIGTDQEKDDTFDQLQAHGELIQRSSMSVPGSTCADSGILEWYSAIKALPDIPTEVLWADRRSCPSPCPRWAVIDGLLKAFAGVGMRLAAVLGGQSWTWWNYGNDGGSLDMVQYLVGTMTLWLQMLQQTKAERLTWHW